MKLYDFQKTVLCDTENKNRVAYYLDMGLGKTFVGSEKLKQLGADTNLIICQKSKIIDWVKHFNMYYPEYTVYNLSNKIEYNAFFLKQSCTKIGIINYDLLYRRSELQKLTDCTLVLDESSLISNPTAKRTKAILKIKFTNVILLSGTPTDGKYERLWTQAKLLGWDIKKQTYYDHYIIEEKKRNYSTGQVYKTIKGYKNVERLKRKFREHGAVFMKTEEVIGLPPQTFITVHCEKPKGYDKFIKRKLLEVSDGILVGDTPLKLRLYARQLCGMYSEEKLEAFRNILESTEDRLIVFYNFTAELYRLEEIAKVYSKPVSVVNGTNKNLVAYENYSNSVTFIQYQAGAMGLNLQKANKIIYYTLPEKSELFEQSKKRIHRVGQNKPCFYYILESVGTIENRILKTLEMRKDFTDELFRLEVEQ